MIRQDYLLRLAEQIGAALAALLVNARHQGPSPVLEECRALCRQHVGLELDLIVRLAPPNLLSLLQQGGNAWSGKAAVLVEILTAQGQLAESVQDPQTALPCYVHARHLLLALAPLASPVDQAELQGKLELLTRRLQHLGLNLMVPNPAPQESAAALA